MNSDFSEDEVDMMIRMHKLLGNRHVYAINYITISAVAPLAKRQHEKIKKYAVYLFEI